MTETKKSRIELSPLALGCWGFSDTALWGETSERDAIATIHAALDHGITLLDTAPAYGDGLSEKIVGKAVAGRRENAVIATKVSPESFSAEGVQKSLEGSLKRLGIDAVDLLQVHWVGDEARFDSVISAFEKLRDSGKVRACGVCNFGPKHLNRLREFGEGWITNQLPYNLLWRAIEFDIVEPSASDGLGILAYSPLQQGLLAGKYQSADDVPDGRARSRHFSDRRKLSRHGEKGCEVETFGAIGAIRRIADRIGHPMSHVAIAWLRAQKGVTSIITGATKPEQVIDNAKALELKLDADTLAQLTVATDKLKNDLGNNPDMWAAESRYR